MVASSSRRAKILRRTAWGVSLSAALTLALVWAGTSETGAPVALLAGLFGFAGLVELALMGRLREEGLFGAFFAGGLLSLLVSWAQVDGLLPAALVEPLRAAYTPRIAGILVVVPVLVALTSRTSRGTLTLGPRLVVAALLTPWVGYPFACLHMLWAQVGHTAFVALLVLSKVGDIAGYYLGSALGRTHPFPSISPGKTTAGCVGSLAVATAAAVLAAQLGWLGAERWPWISGLFFGVLVNLAAQAGDLFESLVKRRSGVKDSGTWFGPSGGVLDLVDSLLFTVPTALFTWPLFFSPT